MPPPSASLDQPRVHLRIEPRKGWRAIDLHEVWEYRELLFFLAWRDVKVRYKQTMLGVAWAVLVPLLTMVVFNLLFSLIAGRANLPSAQGVPYALSTFAALVPWTLFANSLSQSSGSIVANRGMITKVYFPRLIVPLAPILSSLVDFAIAFGVLLLMVAGYHLFTDYQFTPSWRLALLPLFVLLAVVTALAFAMTLSALNALYRDVRYVLPFMIQTLMFVSPVVYSMDSVLKETTPLWVSVLFGLNPLTAVLQGFRWALFGSGLPPAGLMIASGVIMCLMTVGSAFFFRRMERHFADVA